MRASSAVASREPSSTTTISVNSHEVASSQARTVRKVAGSRFSSLYAGMIMEMDLRKRRLIIAGLVLLLAAEDFNAETRRRGEMMPDHTLSARVVFLRVSAPPR